MKSHYKWYISMGLILLLQAWYCFDSACFWSPTHDEYWHLPVGILHWQTGKFDMDVLNPPLVRMWDAIPQFWLPYHEITVSPGQDPARHGDAFFEAYGKDVRIMLIWGRMMNVILSMMITIVIMHRVSKLAGKVAAAVAGFLWITNPNVIAHSSLVTTDLGAALAFIAVMELTFRLIKRKTAFTAVSLGIITGAALATKYTCLILPPLSLITYIFWLKFSGEKMCQSEKNVDFQRLMI